jgi:hypothetical protein
MKIFKRLLLLGVVTFILEASFLFYINNYYLSEEQAFTLQSDTVAKEVFAEKKLIINLPEQYKDFKISYDGSYVSYIESGKLKVVSMKDGSSNEISIDGDVEQSYYGWLDDRNRIVSTEKKQKDSKWVVKFYHYDVKTQEKVEVKDFINEKEVFLTLDGKGSQVGKIEFNTLNTIIYPKININENESKLYRVDATAPIELIKTQTKSIGDIRVIKNLDKVAYEDIQNKKIYLSDSKTAITIKDVSEYKLLSVDDVSKIYIGSVINGKIDRVFYKNLKDKEADWLISSLENPVLDKDIYITFLGEIFINDAEKAIIKSLSSTKEFKYEGTILGGYNEGVIVINNKGEISNLIMK